MLKKIYFLVITMCAINGLSQTLTVYGTVLDSDDLPVSRVRYYSSQDKANKMKNLPSGEYSYTYKIGTEDTLFFEHIAFEDFILPITKRMVRRARRDTLFIDITLPDRTFNEVVIQPKVPDTLFGTQEYSVADFEFHSSGNIVLLTYEKNMERGSVLRLLDTNNTITDKYYIDGDAVELRCDFRGNVHLIQEEKVMLVTVDDDQMKVYLEDRDYFFKYVSPIIDTIGSNIYYSNYSDIYPAFDYFEFDRKDSAYKNILVVEDSAMMELYRAEFKFVDVRTQLWAHNKQLQTGIDKEIWVGATVFTNSLYYEPLYAPLFKVGEDSVFVFDHYKNLMFKYTPEIGFTDSVHITYHKAARKSGWEQPLMQDKVNDKIYGVFLRNGYTYLSEINRNTGQIEKSFRLHYKYVEKIQIIGDYVYYVYRPFESVQKKYIYREKLEERV